VQHDDIRHWLASQGVAQEPDHAGRGCVTMCSNPRVSSMLLRVLDREGLRQEVWHRSHDQPADNMKILGA
jgi:hypothetical protein